MTLASLSPRYGLRQYLKSVLLVGPFELVELWMVILGVIMGLWVWAPQINALRAAPGYTYMLLAPAWLWGLAFGVSGALGLAGALAAVPYPATEPRTRVEAAGDMVMVWCRLIAELLGGSRVTRRAGNMGLAMTWTAAFAACAAYNWRFIASVVYPMFAAASLFVYMRVGRSPAKLRGPGE